MGLITNPINRVEDFDNLVLGGNFEAKACQLEGNWKGNITALR